MTSSETNLQLIRKFSLQYNGGSNCGRTVHITNTATGAAVTAVVADECPSESRLSSSCSEPSTNVFSFILFSLRFQWIVRLISRCVQRYW